MISLENAPAESELSVESTLSVLRSGRWDGAETPTKHSGWDSATRSKAEKLFRGTHTRLQAYLSPTLPVQ
jgi:hypothetical protein